MFRFFRRDPKPPVPRPRRGRKKAEERAPSPIVEVTGQLAAIPEFGELSIPQLARLARLPVRTAGKDEVIIQEGKGRTDELIVILSGTVYVRKRVEEEGAVSYEQVAEIHGPALVGENSFFTGLARSAAVVSRDRTPHLAVDRRTLMRLLSLDRGSFVRFLRRLAKQNVDRAAKTLATYLGTLQLVLPAASRNRSVLAHRLARYEERLVRFADEPKGWEGFIGEILIFQRNLNEALELLYHFAHLPDLVVLTADPARFALPAGDRSHAVCRRLVEELSRMAELVPLSTVSFKETLLTVALASSDRGTHLVEYPAMIAEAASAYRECMLRPAGVGLTVRIRRGEGRHGSEDEDKLSQSALLWEELD